jgi:hypothetical protein
LELSDNRIDNFAPDNVKPHLWDVWEWDPSKQNWEYYSSDLSSEYYGYYPVFTNIRTDRGFWVNYDGSSYVSFPIYGLKPIQDTVTYDSLNPGWTIVGYPCINQRPLTGVYGSAWDVWEWNPLVQNWAYYSIDSSSEFYQYYPTISNLKPGYGYWINKLTGVQALDDNSSNDAPPEIPYVDLNGSIVSYNIPSTMTVGQSYAVSITMNNSGNAVWNSTVNITLGGVGGVQGDAVMFGPTTFNITNGINVTPGQFYTWNFTMTAPTQMGTYTPQYQVKYGESGWFGDIVSKKITVNLPPTGYSFVKLHSILGSSDGALADYPIKYIVHSGSGFDNGRDVYLNGRSLNWPNDIRFTDSNNNTYSYWIESSNASVATVWVNVISIPASPGTTTVKLFYGKSGDSGASNGSNTFAFFDDFLGTSYDVGKWTLSGGSGKYANVANGELSVGQTGGIGSDFKTISSWDSGYAMRAKMKSKTSVTSSYSFFNPPFQNTEIYITDMNGRQETFRYRGGVVGMFPYTAQTYSILDCGLSGMKLDYYINDGSHASYSYYYSGGPGQLDMYSNSNGGFVVDWVAIRAYTYNEPTHGSWIDPYSYVKTHTIQGSSDGALTNYQFKFIVHNGSGNDSGQDVYLNGCSQSWPNDIRFTDSNNNLYSYWVESYDANTATVWVKVDNIPASPSTTTVKLFYGKAGDTSVSNGGSTFLLFDDFSGSLINTSLWSVDSGVSTSVNNGILTITWPSSEKVVRTKPSYSVLGPNVAFESNAKASSGNWKRLGLTKDGNGGKGQSFVLDGSSNWNGETSLVEPDRQLQSLGANYAGAYHRFMVNRFSNKADFYVDNVLKTTNTQKIYTGSDEGINLYSCTLGTYNIDWCFVRKTTNNQPTHGTWL